MPSVLQLVLVMGVAGSGKTTLSKEIVRSKGFVYLDNNIIADAFFPDTRTVADYLALRPGIYDALYAITEANLRLGNSVLLDVPHVTYMQQAEWRQKIRDLEGRTRSVLRILRCLCSEQELYERIRRRGEPRDAWKLQNWEEFLRREPLKVAIPFDHLDIDTERPLEENVSAALRYLRREQVLPPSRGGFAMRQPPDP